MSKDHNKTIELPVETVEKIYKTLSYIDTTLIFWKAHEHWPMNLIHDAINELIVSLSHIIDK